MSWIDDMREHPGYEFGVDESDKYNDRSYVEVTAFGDEFKTYMPIIRQVFPKLIAQELVGVQPMEGINFGKVIEAMKIVEQANKFVEFFKEEEFNI
jgi:hypothetical protein